MLMLCLQRVSTAPHWQIKQSINEVVLYNTEYSSTNMRQSKFKSFNSQTSANLRQ